MTNLQSNKKTTILTFTGGYLPGYKGGGPIRSIASLVDILGDEFHFKIITLDRDLGSKTPYTTVISNKWQRVGKADVFYVSPKNLAINYLRHLINSVHYDTLYFNSFFSPRFTILPMLLRRLGLISAPNVIIAPRGEFSPGALKIKSAKKRFYITMAKKIGLYRDVLWQASSLYEEQHIRDVFSEVWISVASVPIVVASDLTSLKQDGINVTTNTKEAGTLKIIFLSRITHKKNLDGALRMLHNLKGAITFSIYGPREDHAYSVECDKIVSALPANIKADFKGEIAHDKVPALFANNHLFFFPTHGENFGHVIIEALIAGCPVLLSDQTPWRDLEKAGVGWDLPLSEQDRFTAVLQKCVDMGNDEWELLSKRAREYGIKTSADDTVVQQNRALFNSIQ